MYVALLWALPTLYTILLIVAFGSQLWSMQINISKFNLWSLDAKVMGGWYWYVENSLKGALDGGFH